MKLKVLGEFEKVIILDSFFFLDFGLIVYYV